MFAFAAEACAVAAEAAGKASSDLKVGFACVGGEGGDGLGLMNSAGHIIKRLTNPHFQSQMASHDVACTIHLSLATGAARSARAK